MNQRESGHPGSLSHFILARISKLEAIGNGISITIRTSMQASGLKKEASTHSRFVLAAFGFSMALTASGLDFDTDWAGFPKPLTQTTRFGISPFFGYRFGGEIQDAKTGEEYSLKDAPAYGLFLDYAPIGYFGRFEVLWSRQDSSVNFNGNNGLGNVDVIMDVFQIGGECEYGSDRFRLYVSADLGATHFSTDGYGDTTQFSFGIGGGVKAFLTKNLYLRADLRGFGTVTQAEGSFLFVNGVTVATFSGTTFWQGQVSAGIGVTF